jgi:hypothetical protein
MPKPTASQSLSVIFLLLVLSSFPSRAKAQEVTLSISPEIDSINAALLKNPDDRSLQLRVIQAYTLSFNPELALLEIVNTEARNKGGLSDAGIKGRVQMSLEQVDPALHSLEAAYLQTPSDETLMLVAILEYARGQTVLGRRQLERLKSRSTNLGVDLLKIYERFYLNGRKRIAGAILHGLQDVDPAGYRTFFPLPQLSILSPADDFSTEASQTSVIVEVHHTRPLQTVRIGDSVLVSRPEGKLESPTENVSQTFSPLIPLKEGRNSVVVEVTDVFGNTARDSVRINGMNFIRLASWSSPLVDTLTKRTEFLRNYVPDSVLVKGRQPSARALIVSAGPGLPMDRGLFLHELLTNRVSGFVPPENIKILVGDRVEHQNISLITSNWLLKGATFQSSSIVYLAGTWRITENEWNLLDAKGQATNMKPILQTLGSTASAGAIVLIDGLVDNSAELGRGLNTLVQGATIPLEAIVLGQDRPWPEELEAASLQSDSTRVIPDSARESLTVTDLMTIVPGSVGFVRESVHPSFAWNPIGIILRNHQRMLDELGRRLSAEKIQQAVRSRIIRFSRDWKRYNEISRYLSNQLSLADFIVRVEEFESRTGNQ